MSPTATSHDGGYLIEEYYWSGEMVVYIDHQLKRGCSFEAACKWARSHPKPAEAKQ